MSNNYCKDILETDGLSIGYKQRRSEDLCLLSDLNLTIRRGELVCLLGPNGSGKSTLMNILFGMRVIHDTGGYEGEVIIGGETCKAKSSEDVMKLGIGMVHQEFMLLPDFTIAENIKLNREITTPNVVSKVFRNEKLEFLNRKQMDEDAKAALDLLGMDLSEKTKVAVLPIGHMQFVEIAREIDKAGIKLLVFDEPTAVLIPQEVKELYKIMDNLIEEGKTIIFISHKLQEVLDISDNITVIRRGKDVANFETKDATKQKIANAMVGRPVLFTTEKPEVTIGDKIVEIKDLNVKNNKGLPAVKKVSLDIRAGEVFGIAGVEGSGQSELVEAMTGLRKIESGAFTLNGENLAGKTPRHITLAGLAHVPEDRHARAAVSEFSVRDTFAFGVHREKFTKNKILLDVDKLEKEAEFFMEAHDIRPRGTKTAFGKLSGGNQQKIIVARELEKKHDFIIASQPTRGVDIGAIEAIHKLILEEKKTGKAVMVVSAELSEILNLSDRIAVMCGGEITGILDREDATEEKIGILMAGGKL